MLTLPIDYLHELFDVDFAAGTLTWRERPASHFRDGKHSASHAAARWNRRFPGKAAGALSRWGYMQLTIDGRKYLVHRIIFAMAHGRWPEEQLDHANGVRTDNRLSNLRAVSHAENQKNKAAQRGGTSRFPGVSWSKGKGKWRAQIKVDGTLKHLGYFTNELDAAAAYRTAARAFGFTERHLKPAEGEA